MNGGILHTSYGAGNADPPFIHSTVTCLSLHMRYASDMYAQKVERKAVHLAF